MNKTHQNIYQRFVDMVGNDYLFFSHEFDGTMTYVSRHVNSMLEITEKELIGQKWHEALNMPVESLEQAIDAVTQCANGKVPKPYEMKFITPSNKAVYLEIQEHPFYDEDGNLAGVDGIAKDITLIKRNAEERDKLLEHLQKSIEEIKTLRGIIPICSYCHNIRTTGGAWNQLEKYISDHSEAQFSHGICPKCLENIREKNRNNVND